MSQFPSRAPHAVTVSQREQHQQPLKVTRLNTIQPSIRLITPRCSQCRVENILAETGLGIKTKQKVIAEVTGGNAFFRLEYH